MRLVIATVLGASVSIGCATTQRTLAAKHGDRIVITDDDRIHIVRRRQAAVRTIFLSPHRDLIVLLDYAGRNKPPDGRPDTAMRYAELDGDWPLGERWEGSITVIDYTTESGFPRAFGVMTPRGLVQLVSSGDSSATVPLRDPAAVQVFTFRGAGSSAANATNFDEAERLQLAVTAKDRSTREARNLSISAIGSVGDGRIPAPRKIRDVAATMPDSARQANLAETVMLDITVAPDGSVANAKPVRGHPLLNDAAIAAVREWKYEPTVVNGKAISVNMTVVVPFVP